MPRRSPLIGRCNEIQPPATVDGGDVLVAGRRVFVGRSTRTNDAALVQMRRILEPFGYTVSDAEVRGCLHLKSAVTALADDVLLVNREWIDASAFAGFSLVEVAPEEPSAANALRLADRIIVAPAFPRTADRIARAGLPRGPGGRQRAGEGRGRGDVLQPDSES